MGRGISARRARRIREWLKVTQAVSGRERMNENARKDHEEHRAKIDFLTSTPWRG